MIGIGSLVDDLYKLDINVSHINEFLHASNCGIRRKLSDDLPCCGTSVQDIFLNKGFKDLCQKELLIPLTFQI